jgi:hypothetical protein
MSKSYLLTKPGWMERSYALRRENEDVGRLDLGGLWTTQVHAHAPNHEWIFERHGVISPVLTVRRAADGSEILKAAMRAAGDVEVVLQGRTFRWKSMSGWRGEFAWVSADDAPLIHFRPHLSSQTIEQQIEVMADDLPLDDERLLILLGGYLAAATYTEMAAISAVFVATALVS